MFGNKASLRSLSVYILIVLPAKVETQSDKMNYTVRKTINIIYIRRNIICIYINIAYICTNIDYICSFI